MTDLRTKLAQGWEMTHSHRESTATAYALLIIAECLVEQREHDSGELEARIAAEAREAAERMKTFWEKYPHISDALDDIAAMKFAAEMDELDDTTAGIDPRNQ